MTDRNEERTFAALPPAQGRGFAQTWWGQAWLKALEDAALDSEPVKTGRRLARAGAVGAVSVRPGRITAVVQDRDRTAHRADVLLQELSEEQWDRFLDMAVERAGHIAALLDRDMPPHLVEDAAAAGVELLPGLGDLEAECGCGAWDHCGHTAALCYQMARLLDQDPFALLLMRGRGERALLDELQVRGSAPTEEPDTPDTRQEGVDAAEAFAAGDILPPLPALPELPEEPGQPPSLDTETAPAPGLDPDAVEFLATTAAGEAYRLLAEALGSGHGQQAVEAEPTLAEDAVRLAAGSPEQAIAQRLAVGSGRDREELRLAVSAWRYGVWPRCPSLRTSGPWRRNRWHARVPLWSRRGTRTSGHGCAPQATAGRRSVGPHSCVSGAMAGGGRIARSGADGPRPDRRCGTRPRRLPRPRGT